MRGPATQNHHFSTFVASAVQNNDGTANTYVFFFCFVFFKLNWCASHSCKHFALPVDGCEGAGEALCREHPHFLNYTELHLMKTD